MTTLNKADVLNALDSLPVAKKSLGQTHGSFITLIVNDTTNNNIGFDVTFSMGKLTIIRFMREPYRQTEITSGYENISLKNQDLIRRHLIAAYFPEVAYIKLGTI
tara:strand:+ start:372 stop:686 length:315 start_codon:yes stop_codon:yes gene_type:complete